MARKRRGRGEGGVYQRDDGMWVGSVSLGFGEDGKRRRRILYGKTKGEVLEKLERFRQDVRQGLGTSTARLTLGEFLDYWLESDVKPNRAPGTVKCYGDTIRLHIRPHIGRVQLSQLQADHVTGLYATLCRTGVPARTRQLVHAVLHRAVKRAVAWKRASWNPVSTVERPKVPRKDMTAVTAEQARALLKAAAGHRLEALFTVDVATGLRQGEVFALRWQDVDLARAQLHVRHSLEELKGKLRLKEPKSAKSRRTVELSALAVNALTEHRKRMLAEGHCAPDRPVFCDCDGGFLRKSNFTRDVYAPIRTAAGLTGLGFHQWRHMHATLLVEAGTDPRVIQERLGHADVGTTLRFYVHPRQETHRKAADAFDTAFRSAESG
ncbi:MAG TPA: tyrosine-type recombinase/integrase [Urbifossiella sp.]|nr:tyrosine-type recombinase/integrase [Urbifossiella sp.]